METIVTFFSLIALVVIFTIASQAVSCYLETTSSPSTAGERMREVFSQWSNDSRSAATIAFLWLVAAVLS